MKGTIKISTEEVKGIVSEWFYKKFIVAEPLTAVSIKPAGFNYSLDIEVEFSDEPASEQVA